MKDLQPINSDVYDYIKNNILKYYPLNNDRLYMLSNEVNEIEILIRIINNKTNVNFLCGNNHFKTSNDDYQIINEIIELNQIFNIVDFLLSDHRIISNIELTSSNIFKLVFDINWSNDALKGISCGPITLKIDFKNNIELSKNYITALIVRYECELSRCKIFNELKEKYFEDIKQYQIDLMNKDEILQLINELNEEEVKNLFRKIDNKAYYKICKNSTELPKILVK